MSSHAHGATSKDAVQVKHTFIDVKTPEERHLEPERRYTDTCVEYASTSKLRCSTASASTIEPLVETGSDSEGSGSGGRPRFDTGGSCLESSYTSALSGPPGTFGGASSTNGYASQDYAWDMSQVMMMMPMPMMTPLYAPHSGAAREKKGKKEPKAKPEWEETRVMEVPEDEQTTVIFRHLTQGCKRDDMLELLDAEGFKTKYDFVYMPTHFKNWTCFGYAFVNFRTHELALEAMQYFQGREWETAEGDRPCEVVWSNAHQGLESHIERYRNSPLMHDSVPDEARPAMFDESGRRIAFPAPTKRIKPPHGSR